METDPLIHRPSQERRETVITITGAGNNFRLLQKRSRSILSRSYINLLLIFVPFGVATGFIYWPFKEVGSGAYRLVFALNFLALIPLENAFHIVAEKLFLPYGNGVGTALSVVLPHLFPLIVSRETSLRI